jgi:mannose-binding lectin 1
MDDWFETDSQRELRQIFQGQNQIFQVVRELNNKLDEVVGRQERTMSLISQTSGGVAAPSATGHAPAPPGGFPDTIRRHEVDAVFNNQNQILSTVREIRQFVLELKTRADTIINNQAKQPTAQVQSLGYDTQSLISEMRDGLNHVKQNVAQVAQKIDQSPTGCPSVSCVSVTAVLAIAVVQLLLILGYNIYRDSKENQAKKFY